MIHLDYNNLTKEKKMIDKKIRFYKNPSRTKIDDMIRGHHENYKQYLTLKRKKAIQLKSKANN